MNISIAILRRKAKAWHHPCFSRGTVLELCDSIERAEADLAACQQSLAQSRAEVELLHRAHEQSKKGTGVLLGFIHATHRLGTTPPDGSIRNQLEKAQRP